MLLLLKSGVSLCQQNKNDMNTQTQVTEKMNAALKMFKRSNLPTCALIEKFAIASEKFNAIPKTN